MQDEQNLDNTDSSHRKYKKCGTNEKNSSKKRVKEKHESLKNPTLYKLKETCREVDFKNKQFGARLRLKN